MGKCCILSKFYIKPQLEIDYRGIGYGCILSKFYIKPQPKGTHKRARYGCILSKFYIKPQLRNCSWQGPLVVSYRNSTSNHNLGGLMGSTAALYLIEILHQTTTVQKLLRKQAGLYLIEILHQTTTVPDRGELVASCILSKFYIKPQLHPSPLLMILVVSYRNSTSNHNNLVRCTLFLPLYLIEILHQTTTQYMSRNIAGKLYLIEILHQTTTG